MTIDDEVAWFKLVVAILALSVMICLPLLLYSWHWWF
jgi:hypothetical protein